MLMVSNANQQVIREQNAQTQNVFISPCLAQRRYQVARIRDYGIIRGKARLGAADAFLFRGSVLSDAADAV